MSTVGKKVKFGFGIGDLGGNLFFTIIGFYLLYYLTDVVQISAALAGTILMIGKIWDAITDPITGYISDNTRSRWGRRRPYMFFGAIISAIFMGLMFTTPMQMGPVALFFYITVLYCVLNTAFTLVNIPYAALLPELTDDYHQRTILTGYRMSFAVVGTFIGAGAVMPIIGLFTSFTMGWSVMGYIMGGIMLLSTLITVWAIREPVHTEKPVSQNFFVTYKETLRNKVFLLALIPWALFITGTSMVQGALVYYFAYILHNEGLFQIALLLLLLCSLLCIPLWVRVSRSIGKKNCYMIGMGIMACGVMIFSLAGASLGPTVSVIIMGISGIGLSTHYVMPHAILPDVVEYDAITQKHGRREGVFSSLWTFSSKIGQAFALALNGWILSLFSYSPNEVTPLAQVGIRLICGPIPFIWYLIGIIVINAYPIDSAFYAEMMNQKG